MRYTLIFSAIILSLFSCTQGRKPDINKEIAAIEANLLTTVQVKGEAAQRFSLAERMEHYNVRGLSIAVVKDGEIRWAKGYGTANAEEGKKVDENTLFQAGSISKPLSALAALQLAEKGKVALDEDINRYLTSWKLPENSFTQKEKVTLRRLLTHTAGLTVSGFPGYTQTDAFPSDVKVLDGEGNTSAVKVDTLPGSMWRYSGGGYTIMERMVEDVSGMSLEEYMAKNVLAPLGMKNSTFAQPLPAEKFAYASAAFDAEGETVEGLWHNYPEQAAAGLWTTPTDLANYCIAIQKGVKGEANSVLSQQMIEKMLTKHQFNWGLGPQLRGAEDSLIFQHGGKNAGFTNNMMASAHQGNAIIVMTNSDQGINIIREITLGISDFYGWKLAEPRYIQPVELAPARLEALTGVYQSPHPLYGSDEYQVEVKKEEGQFVVEDLMDGQRLKLTALSDSAFLDTEQEIDVEFEEGDGRTTLVWGGMLRFDKIK